ncbi:MAG: ABC transporter substrate-binding protein [Alphaproteobacteria bacterium]|nr:ABC transporter substrate-binding protein [Alphaproteobacteria bacterium]
MMMKRVLWAMSVATGLAASGAALAAEQVNYTTSWIPTGDEAYAYVAAQEGFFAAEGIEVNITVGRGSLDGITKVSAGIADFADMAVGALMGAVAENKDVPVKCVLSVYSKQPDAIFTAKGSGITSIKDLAGRKVVTAPFTSSNTIWPAFVALNGVEASQITLLKADPNTLAPMLATGQVDATIDWVTDTVRYTRFLKEANKDIVIIPWSSYGLEGYGLSLAVSDKMIKTNPKLVAGFVRAYKKAIDFMIADPAKSAKDLKAMVPAADLESDTAEIASIKGLLTNEITDKYGMGTFEPALLRKTWEWVAKAQNYPLDKINPEMVVDRSFLPK